MFTDMNFNDTSWSFPADLNMVFDEREIFIHFLWQTGKSYFSYSATEIQFLIFFPVLVDFNSYLHIN